MTGTTTDLQTHREVPAVSLCSFRVGRELFGVATESVQQVLGESNVTPVPLAPWFVGGIMPYRGDVLMVLCLRRILGLPPLEKASVMVLRDTQAGTVFGLAADGIEEVLHVDRQSFECNPCTLDQRRAALLIGAYKLPESLILVVDPERLRPALLSNLSSSKEG